MSYEDFLIREMTEPENPEGELDPTESPGWGEDCEKPKEDCVHNPGSECVLIPAEPGSPSNFPVPVLAEPTRDTDESCLVRQGEARESTESEKPRNNDHRSLERGAGSDSRGGETLSLDKTESACQWLDTNMPTPESGELDWAWDKDEPAWNFPGLKWKDGGAYFGNEAEPYTHDEAEARRREANE